MIQKAEPAIKLEKADKAANRGESSADNDAEQKRRLEEPAIELMGFRLAGEEYAIDIMRVKEITPVFELTPIPRAPDYVLGILSLRGNIIPIFDPKKRIGLPATELTGKSRIIVLRSDEDEIGILVDAITSSARVPLRSIEPTPSVIRGIEAEYVNGVATLGDRVIIIMNMDEIIKIHGMK